jgi:hypothetical protein
MFAVWLKFSLIEELTYEIDVWFQEKILTNDELDMIWSPAFQDICLVGSLFQSSYTFIFITYS